MKTFNEARSYPRRLCSISGRIRIGDLQVDGEAVDISRGGVKFLPGATGEFFTDKPAQGVEFDLTLAGVTFFGNVAWMSPSFAALGCSFDKAMSEDDLTELLKSSALPKGL